MKKYFGDNRFTYIKIGLSILLLIFIIWDVGSDPISDASIQKVTGRVVRAAGLTDSKAAESRMIKRFYGLNPGDYEGAVLYAPKDNMDVNEIFIVKLADVSQSKAVETAIEKRLETQIKSFEGYGPQQVALLKAHVLEVRGNYIFYMVGDKADRAQKAFLDSL